tara:strand:+ start:183 stop:596 length:414 start_codon:yes stop_codon:yes gene_type:complete
MMREKIILSLVALVIGAVFIEFLPIMFPSINARFYKAGSQEYSILENQKHLESSDSNPVPLSVGGWGKDIFHDRSNVYNSWFRLTGITRFENGYKAIINGEIVHERTRVRGFKVTKITYNQVVLQRNEYRVTLKLQQ